MLRTILPVAFCAGLAVALLTVSAFGRAQRGPADAFLPSPGWAPAPYAEQLSTFAADRMKDHPEGDLAVYVRDIERGEEVSIQGDRRMYLASGIKMMFVVELFRQREAGLLSFDEKLRYSYRDYRDGAPAMNRRRAGDEFPISELMTFMIRDSDNAATDMLLERITPIAVERGLLLDGHRDFGPVVNMLDARLGVYTRLDPRAKDLRMWQVRDIRWRDGHHPRLDLLRKHIGPPHRQYDEHDLDAAYDDYYALGRNHMSMRLVADVLTGIVQGKTISKGVSQEIRTVLEGAWSSGNRIRGAIPAQFGIAHKTGTQHERICDLALIELPDGRPLVVAIAVQGLYYETAEPILSAVARRAWDLAGQEPGPTTAPDRVARRAP